MKVIATLKYARVSRLSATQLFSKCNGKCSTDYWINTFYDWSSSGITSVMFLHSTLCNCWPATGRAPIIVQGLIGQIPIDYKNNLEKVFTNWNYKQNTNSNAQL